LLKKNSFPLVGKNKEETIKVLKGKFLESIIVFISKAPYLTKKNIYEMLEKIESRANEKELHKELDEVLSENKKSI